MTTKTKAVTAGFDPAIPLAKIHQHPKNPRRNATASDELVASVKAQGLMQALVLAPHAELIGEYVLIAGHRRRDALERAGAKTAKAEIRDDLVTEVQQIEAMLIENSGRADLTAMEEAEAYEQLQLFNLKPADIAKAVGKSRTTVSSRLKLLNLGEQARTKLHDGQVTIDDALALADLPKAARDQLENTLGTAHFRTELTRHRERAQKIERFKADQKVAEELGIPAYANEPVDVWHLHRAGEVQHIAWLRATDAKMIEVKDQHAECLRWFHYVEITGTPVVAFGCADPDSHIDEHSGQPGTPSTTTDEERAKQAAREEKFAAERAAAEQEAEDRRVAARLRFETMGACDPALVFRAGLPLFMWSMESLETGQLEQYLGIERVPGEMIYQLDAGYWPRVVEAIDKATNQQVVTAVIALLSAELAWRAEEGVEGGNENPLVARFFDHLLDLGHEFTDVDRQQHAVALGRDIDEDGDE
jgi:ParB/RepB/Spo0J family partition protein